MNNTTNITCPKCGAEIPLTEAVSHNVREELAAQFDKQLHAEKQKLKADAMLKAQQNVSLELADLRNQVQEQQARLNQAQSAELELRRKQRELQTAHQNQELELARKLEAERLKIAAEARQQAIEAERLKLNEKELIIQGLTEQITALKQRAEQGSMQLQGEVLELDLEARLAAQFPGDGVEPVAKGQRGADVLQRVRSNLGHDCGTILWETKRARNWSKDWLSKLKEDQRAAKADLAVLVSQVLPAEVIGFGWFDGVWVCDPANAMPLAVALRQGVVTAAVARQAEVGRQGKMEELYQFLTSVEFRQRIEGVLAAFKSLREDLEAEKRALQKHWARREKQIDQATVHTAMLYGSVQGIVGQAALPEIKILQLDDSAGSQIENRTSQIVN